ncbi:capreomycidine synthase [Pseudoalteromonas rubra]|uniref:capreomycidine synthase n=1 Tax=Pseudoalteromonas rubra TaxID=43658 RepID=UPI000F7A9D01|nr:capreomycidine synthase [Pseudoalteromonas rubra]
MKPANLEDWYRDRYFADVTDISGSGVYDYNFSELLALSDFEPTELNDLVFHDNPTFGDYENRRIIAQRWGTGDPERVITCNGSNEALSLIMNATLQAGDEVVSVSPFYHCHANIAEHIGCKVSYWTLQAQHDFQPDFTQLKALLNQQTKMVVVNFPHNPTGINLTEAQMRELVDIVASVDAFLLWDGAFEDLQFDNQTPTPIALYDKCILTSTFSKAYGFPGLRYGWCIMPDELLRDAQIYKDYSNLYVSVIVEKFANVVLRNIDKFYRPRYQEAAENRALMQQWFDAHQAYFQSYELGGGVTCFPRFKGAMSTQALCDTLFEQYALLLVPGECFDCPGHVRIGFGTEQQTLKKGLDTLSKALDELCK